MPSGLTLVVLVSLLAAPVATLVGVVAGAWMAVRIRTGQSPMPSLRRTDKATEEPKPPKTMPRLMP